MVTTYQPASFGTREQPAPRPGFAARVPPAIGSTSPWVQKPGLFPLVEEAAHFPGIGGKSIVFKLGGTSLIAWGLFYSQDASSEQKVYSNENHEDPPTNHAHISSPSYLSLNNTSSIFLWERRPRMRGLQASIALSSLNNHSHPDGDLQATKPIFFWTHSIWELHSLPSKDPSKLCSLLSSSWPRTWYAPRKT